MNLFLLLVWMEKEFKTDRYLFPHTAYFIREMRIKAYSQLLESYRSLSLLHMAQTFGVSEGFIDRYYYIHVQVRRMVASFCYLSKGSVWVCQCVCCKEKQPLVLVLRKKSQCC